MKHSQIRKFLRRGCSLLLTGALCMPSAVFASQGEPRIQTSHELLDGLTYINTVSEHTAGRTESFVLELAEDSKVFPILLQSSGTIYGTATINAAVNTDYFSTATGVPMGIVIEDGVYKSDAAGNPAMVIVDGEVLGKPHDAKEAKAMLRHLSGRTHQVVTGVWLSKNGGGDGFADVADVVFGEMTEEEIEEYVNSGEPMDKAGAYGIQGCGMRYIDGIRGDFYTVMGLPAGRLYRFLKERL